MTDTTRGLVGELLALAETLDRHGSAVGSGIARRAAQALAAGPTTDDRRRCPGCGRELDGTDPRRLHCGAACRQRAYRRRRADAVTHP